MQGVFEIFSKNFSKKLFGRERSSVYRLGACGAVPFLRLRRHFSTRELSLPPLRLLKFSFFLRRAYPFGALRGPRGGPYFLPLQKVGKDRRKGVSPPCPRVSRRGTSACHARRRMGQRSKRLLRAKPFANLRGSSSRAAARSSAKPRFYSLFWRANCGQRPRQRDRRGGFQRGNAFGLLFCLLFCRSRKVGAPRGPSARRG